MKPFREHLVLALLLGLLASLLLAGGLLMMKSRGSDLPAARGAGLLNAVRRWLLDPVWLGGLALQTGGYGLYLVALSGAPVSLLAVVMQSGIAVFVVFAALFLGERASAREWIGIGGVVAAIVLLGLSLGGGGASAAVNQRWLILVSIASLAAALAGYPDPHLRARGVASSIASGIAFGMGSLYAKAIVNLVVPASAGTTAIAVITSPWLYLAIAANMSGLVLLQNSFHMERGIIVMPLSSACSNLVPIVGGIVAFGERLPADTSAAALRIGAFSLTVVASGLLATARS